MEKFHLPAGYDTVLEEFAKKNNVVFETAFYNLMDFIQLKDYSFHSVKVLVGELYLFYVHNLQETDTSPSGFPHIRELSEVEEKYTKAGYFESIYLEEEEEWED